ncbi:Uncharacterised protein [marine metagenome]
MTAATVTVASLFIGLILPWFVRLCRFTRSYSQPFPSVEKARVVISLWLRAKVVPNRAALRSKIQ